MKPTILNGRHPSKRAKSPIRPIRNKAAAYHKAQPNLGEANKAAGVGAAIQGGLNFGIFVYQKHEEGKEIWQFTAEDWKEGGVKTAEGAFKGGFSGYAIYGLTNVCHLSAPSARGDSVRNFWTHRCCHEIPFRRD